MHDSHDDSHNDSEMRRRRLEDLFADEPFLSPTMKARRLHEKIQEIETPGAPTSGLPTEAFVHCPAPVAPSAPQRMRLAEAAERLRTLSSQGEKTSADPETLEGTALLHFRDHLLIRWLKAAPPREIR